MNSPLPFNFWLLKEATGDSFRIEEGQYHLTCPATKENWRWIESKLKLHNIEHVLPEGFVESLPEASPGSVILTR